MVHRRRRDLYAGVQRLHPRGYFGAENLPGVRQDIRGWRRGADQGCPRGQPDGLHDKQQRQVFTLEQAAGLWYLVQKANGTKIRSASSNLLHQARVAEGGDIWPRL